jgi:hypothetical protein
LQRFAERRSGGRVARSRIIIADAGGAVQRSVRYPSSGLRLTRTQPPRRRSCCTAPKRDDGGPRTWRAPNRRGRAKPTRLQRRRIAPDAVGQRPSLAFRISFTACGLALPPDDFIT